MTSKRKPYKTYPKEFKLEAVRLMEGKLTGTGASGRLERL
jgi:hypothetical protein